jgi:hypothetical protein
MANWEVISILVFVCAKIGELNGHPILPTSLQEGARIKRPTDSLILERIGIEN